MKISALAAAAALVGTELIALVQGGVTVRSTVQAIADAFKGVMAASIASAATPDIGAAAGQTVHITGTTTITGWAAAAAGVQRTTIFDGSLTLTHHATSFVLPTGASGSTGGNIQTVAGDVARWVSEGSGNWRCVSYTRKSGQGLSNAVTAITSASGVLNIDCSLGDYFTVTLTENVTSLTFTNLPPAGAGRTIMLQITQHASAAKTFAFPAAFKWPGGTTGVISTGLSAIDLLAITSFNQGTAWRATLAKAFA